MNQLIEKKEFLNKYNIDVQKFEETKLKWTELQKIYTDYCKEIPRLETSAIYIFNNLMKAAHVHSVRYRIKNSEHLIEKIVRKRIKDSSHIITLENYKTEITDLIGLRALHLFKEEWYPIHDLITTTWDLNEKPIAYYRDGDSSDYKEEFERYGCDTRKHPFGYRSVHYIVETKPAKKVYFAEIQIRTIFEEAWSEIDHRIRYPYEIENILFGQFLLILNRLAGSADEMGTFIQYLKKDMQDKEETYRDAILGKDKLIQQLEQKVKNLKLKDSDLNSLNEVLEKLKIPMTNIQNYKMPDLSLFDSTMSIKMPDLSYLDKIKPLKMPNLSFLDKNKSNAILNIKVPKSQPKK